jgi:hypothetical protein
MQRYSLSLATVLDAGGNRVAIDTFLQGIGKSEADASFAAASDPTGTVAGGVVVFKVSGADASTLLAGIVSVEKSDLGSDATSTQGTVGGKGVTVVSVGSDVNDTEWVYGHNDLVFVVHAADEMHAATFLEALP